MHIIHILILQIKMMLSLSNPFLRIKYKIFFIVFSFMLASCSDEAENMTSSQIVDENSVKKEQLLKQQNISKDHWLLKEKGSFNPSDVSSGRKLDDQETNLLEVDRKEMEIGFKELIEEMDSNLDNPEVRKEITEKMQQNSIEYKQKMLVLAKDKLKKTE